MPTPYPIGEKPHKCDVCAYTTPYASNLRAHKRIHSDIRPFQCEFCPTAFKVGRDDDVDDDDVVVVVVVVVVPY